MQRSRVRLPRRQQYCVLPLASSRLIPCCTDESALSRRFHGPGSGRSCLPSLMVDARCRRNADRSRLPRQEPCARVLLPVLVIPPWRRVSPVERSEGTRPRNAINWRGWSKRRRSPASAHHRHCGHEMQPRASPGMLQLPEPWSRPARSQPRPPQGDPYAPQSPAPRSAFPDRPAAAPGEQKFCPSNQRMMPAPARLVLPS